MITRQIIENSLDFKRLPLMTAVMPEPAAVITLDTGSEDNSSDKNYELIWYFGQGNDYY
jgi:hypothetical protein